MDSAQLYDKSVIARELNKVNGFSAKKIQQHYLMLDADRNPLFTIADIERFLLPTTPRSPFSPIPARTTDVHSSPPSRPLSPTSPEMATTLEVQLLRLSLDLERSLREKAEAFREKAEAERDTARARQENAELRAAAVSSRSPSHCSPRTSPRESAELTGREMLDRLSQCLAPPRAKPTDRYLKDSGVPTYDGTNSPDSFLQQFESMCAQFQVPRESQAVELIALLRGHARDWYLLQEGPLSIQALSLGLTHHFGKPYQAAKAVKDLYGYVPDATLSGPLRLLELNKRLQVTRQYCVVLGPPEETRYYLLQNCFLAHEVDSMLSALNAHADCDEHALHAIPTNDARREILFSKRNKIAEHHLRQVTGRSSGARVRVTNADAPHAEAPSSPAPQPVSPVPFGPTSSTEPVDRDVRCLRLYEARADAINGKGFEGPAHYFGDNKDPAVKTKNREEQNRRKQADLCFKCRMSDLKPVHFLQCALHGADAPTHPRPPTVPRTRRA